MLAGAALVVVMLEIALTVLNPILSEEFYEYDPELGFRVRPNTSGSNQLGFNDRDYPLAKPAGTVRVLVVGDSFSWAGGLDGNYTARLERRFAEQFGADRVEVINIGYPMTCLAEEVAIVRRYGLQYQPDLVVLSFFCGNDFLDASSYQKRIVVGESYFVIDARYERRLPGYELLRWSRLWQYLGQRYTLAWERWRCRGTDAADPYSATAPDTLLRRAPRQEDCTFSLQDYLTLVSRRLAFCERAAQQRGDFRANVAFVAAALAELQLLIERQGAKLHVAALPAEFQVSSELVQQVYSTFQLDRAAYNLTEPQDVLGQCLTARGIPWVDLLPEFRARAADAPLYRCRDSHWNDAGQELAAELLFRHLRPAVAARLAAPARP